MPNKDEHAPTEEIATENTGKTTDGAAAKDHKLRKQMSSKELEDELAAGGFFGKNCYWVSCSLFAGLTMGTGSFIYAVKYADLGFEGGGLTGPIVFVIFLTVNVIREVIHRVKTGSWVKKENSRVYWDDGRVKWSNLVPLCGNVAVNVSYLIVMTYAWYFAELGGINQGVISALLSLASLINVVSFYFGFNEKISCLHFVGVVFMVASVVCIGAAAGSHSGEV